MATLMKTILGGFAAAALLTGGAIVMNASGANVAHAQSSAKATVDAAIARGEVGETITGYLEVVEGAAQQSARSGLCPIDGRETDQKSCARRLCERRQRSLAEEVTRLSYQN